MLLTNLVEMCHRGCLVTNVDSWQKTKVASQDTLMLNMKIIGIVINATTNPKQKTTSKGTERQVILSLWVVLQVLQSYQ